MDDSLAIEEVDRYDRVFILTERGCVNCNRSFSNFIEKELDEHSLCIVNASGRIVDISYYQKNEAQNIIFDYDRFFVKNDVIETSSVIYLKNNEVDTIVELDEEQLGRQFEFFKGNSYTEDY
ncbi:MAG: hypothetical protein ACQERC_04185 [Bacteroidota bacterium]